MGPFPITQIKYNGTVRFQKGIINDATNICIIKPFFDETTKDFLKQQLFLFTKMTMARFAFNKESSMMPPITHQ